MSAIVDRIKREPVLLLTLAVLILQTEGFQDFSWAAPVVAVLGVLTRFFTVPASEVY